MQRREREIDTVYQSEDPSPTLPTYRGKKEKGKIVEDKKGESNWANKKALDLLLKPANPTPSNTGSIIIIIGSLILWPAARFQCV